MAGWSERVRAIASAKTKILVMPFASSLAAREDRHKTNSFRYKNFDAHEWFYGAPSGGFAGVG